MLGQCVLKANESDDWTSDASSQRQQEAKAESDGDPTSPDQDASSDERGAEEWSRCTHEPALDDRQAQHGHSARADPTRPADASDRFITRVKRCERNMRRKCAYCSTATGDRIILTATMILRSWDGFEIEPLRARSLA